MDLLKDRISDSEELANKKHCIEEIIKKKIQYKFTVIE